MRKLMFGLACAGVFILSFSVTGLVLGGISKASSFPPSVETSAEVNTDISIEETEPVFVVSELGGNVVVYRDSPNSSPVIVTDIEVSSLRAYDRDMLRSGITVHSHNEALSLLEDLGS